MPTTITRWHHPFTHPVFWSKLLIFGPWLAFESTLVNTTQNKLLHSTQLTRQLAKHPQKEISWNYWVEQRNIRVFRPRPTFWSIPFLKIKRFDAESNSAYQQNRELTQVQERISAGNTGMHCHLSSCAENGKVNSFLLVRVLDFCFNKNEYTLNRIRNPYNQGG